MQHTIMVLSHQMNMCKDAPAIEYEICIGKRGYYYAKLSKALNVMRRLSEQDIPFSFAVVVKDALKSEEKNYG